MTQSLVVNKIEFRPSTEMAKRFGYTPDYVSRLAREGKVEATRVGRQWFVSPNSLAAFITDAEVKKAAQKEELRQQRKMEREQHAAEADSLLSHEYTSSAAAAMTTQRVFEPKVLVAAVMSLLIMILGVAFGWLGGSVASVALQHTSDLLGKHTGQVTAAVSMGADDSLQDPATSAATQPTHVETINAQQGMVIFDATEDEETVSRIRDSFSDSVKVEFSGADTGMVTPQFRDRTGEQYQFLLVPVPTAS